MLRIVFADAGSWDYNPHTVFERPLGGTHSAACYLAMALARQGHEVYFLSNTSQPGMTHGVASLSWNTSSDAQLRALRPDVVMVIHEPSHGRKLREILGPDVRIIAWTGNAYTPGSTLAHSLHGTDSLWALDGVALVSEWQQRHFLQALPYPVERTFVLRNAIAPAFENLFPPGQSILRQKTAPPLLAYTSTPFRGLDVLASAFPEIRRRIPGTQLQVFSSMQVYLDTQAWAEHATYGALYEQLRRTEGVEYFGSLPQPELAEHMKHVQVLAYTNTFEETSCIAVMEAMASGCQIVTSDYGALPETTAGFADLVPMRRNAREHLNGYIEGVVGAIEQASANPAAVEARLREQVDFVNARCTWSRRAGELVDMIDALPAANLNRFPQAAQRM